MAVLASCALGSPDEPGCTEEAECEEGFVCRAGACIEKLPFTPQPSDAGTDGDAAPDAGDAG